MAKKQSFAEMYLAKKKELEKEKPNTEEKNSTIIDTIEKLREEIEKYNKNEPTDFSSVKWSILVKDKDFTEDMLIMFQVQAQNYFMDFVKTHKVSDELLRKMYYDFMGHFNPSVLDEETRDRVFPELKENKE